MACHGDVVSLGETMERLLQSSKLNRYNTKRLTVAHEEVQSIQRLLQKLDVGCGLVDDNDDSDDGMYYDELKMLKTLSAVLRRARLNRSSSIRSIGHRMNGLDGKMREAARELEDALETHLLNHDQLHDLLQEKLKEDIKSFSRKVMELKEEYAKAEAEEEAEKDEEEEEEAEEEEFRIDDSASGKKMVGYVDVLAKMKDEIRLFSVGVLVGMGGIGKTTLARRFFDDSEVLFDYRVWVDVGPKYQLIDILESIVNQIDPNLIDNMKTLKGQKCLVVLDDVWNKNLVLSVRELLESATFYQLPSIVLVTSRLQKVGSVRTFPWYNKMIKLRFMNKDESWDLLRDKIFGEDLPPCTSELVKAGKDIAENCDGLPLTIVTVANILSKDGERMTPEYWNQVAERKNSVFFDAYERMSKVLLRSYDFLPRYLKEYFLYMGVFPKKCDVPLSKLALLCGAEGCFLLEAPKISKDLQSHISRHMEELIRNSLVLLRKTTFTNKPKTYGLHSALWHSCVREAATNKFSYVFNKYVDSLEVERMRNQRRLCVHNNVLFSIKDVRNSMASISTARSLLCTGPHHQYTVPVCFSHLRLLRVINALTIRFYEFPVEVVDLVRLRYLALTCDGKIPTCISKLSNLEVFIVGRYLNIVKLHEKDESYLPMEIWDMKELQHLQVIGDDLPEPCAGVVLPNLATLIDANAHNCTKGVLKGLPNLKKLGIRIELSADDVESLSISYHNNELESLKCVVVNPVFRSSPIASSLLFPNSLKKLSLNGLGCLWEDINEAVASLPNLEVLKLRCYAFRGSKWETPKKGFRSLRFLLIEDTDLVHWTLGNESFSSLWCLVLKECYKLQDIQPWFSDPLNRIEMVDCSPSAVTWVKKMQAKRSTFKVFVDSSWDDDVKKLKP